MFPTTPDSNASRHNVKMLRSQILIMETETVPETPVICNKNKNTADSTRTIMYQLQAYINSCSIFCHETVTILTWQVSAATTLSTSYLGGTRFESHPK